MKNQNCAYFRKNFFCRKSEKYYVNCPREKTLDKNLCFYASGEEQRKRTKKNQKTAMNTSQKT